MISVFRMGPVASGRGLCITQCVISMEYYSEILNHVSEIYRL